MALISVSYCVCFLHYFYWTFKQSTLKYLVSYFICPRPKKKNSKNLKAKYAKGFISKIFDINATCESEDKKKFWVSL